MAFLIRRGWLQALLVLWVALSNPQCAKANEDLQLAEQEIKAGLLYNFLKYTLWPASLMEGKSSIAVCIFGDDPFGGYLQSMQGRTVNQRAITIRNLRDVTDTAYCHLLLINPSEKEHWPDLREHLREKAVLTVSDFKGFAASGGMIEFGRKDNHINVELNKEALTAAQLQVEDRLLKLVTIVSYPARGAKP